MCWTIQRGKPNAQILEVYICSKKYMLTPNCHANADVLGGKKQTMLTDEVAKANMKNTSYHAMLVGANSPLENTI